MASSGRYARRDQGQRGGHAGAAGLEHIRGQASTSLPEDLAPLYLEYQPGDYERAFTLSDAVDPSGIEARVKAGVLHLRLPKAGPAKRQRIEVRAD
jgi:HSP20 family molecular chaperone IbpA